MGGRRCGGGVGGVLADDEMEEGKEMRSPSLVVA